MGLQGAQDMSKTGWKQHERESAELIDGRRFPANMGDRVDIESDWAVGQCKEVKSLSLVALSALAVEMHEIGAAKSKVGVVIVKASLGSGRKSPRLVVLHEDAWRVIREEVRKVFPIKGTA